MPDQPHAAGRLRQMRREQLTKLSAQLFPMYFPLISKGSAPKIAHNQRSIKRPGFSAGLLLYVNCALV